MKIRLSPLVVAALLVMWASSGCDSGTGPPMSPVVGTWGGKDAGLIAADTGLHVHIGCTLGDARGVIRPDASGRFSIDGTYNVDAFPVDRGIVHPARFSGRIDGRSMTLTVTLTDTARTLGPVTLRYGTEPQMAVCPICRNGDTPMWGRRAAVSGREVPREHAHGDPRILRP